MSGFANKQVDRAIVARAQRGDMKAHEIIYRTFSAPVYTVANRMLKSPAAAEDVLQETFVEVLRSIHGFRSEASLATWIRRIAVSKCLMHLRSAWYKRANLFSDAREDDGEGLSPRLPDSVNAGLQRDLENALGELNETSRAVVLLHDVEGYTHKEIGEMMGKTTSFSKSQLARAHERLQGILGPEMLDADMEIESMRSI